MHIEFLNSTTDGNKRDSINSNVSSISSSPFTFVSGADLLVVPVVPKGQLELLIKIVLTNAFTF